MTADLSLPLNGQEKQWFLEKNLGCSCHSPFASETAFRLGLFTWLLDFRKVWKFIVEYNKKQSLRRLGYYEI